MNGRATRITVDGGSVMEVGNGGSALGFSQEVVQEFQVSTVNMDISGSSTASGAVNVATRSGTNQLHGSGVLLFPRPPSLSISCPPPESLQSRSLLPAQTIWAVAGRPTAQGPRLFLRQLRAPGPERRHQHRVSVSRLRCAERHLSQPDVREPDQRADRHHAEPERNPCSCATHTRATFPTRHSEICTLRRGPGRPVGPTRALLDSLRSWVPAW